MYRPTGLNTKRQIQLSVRLLQGSMGGYVPFTDGRGVKYPARKLMLVIRNNVLISTIPACPFSGDQTAQCIATQLLGGCLGCIE